MTSTSTERWPLRTLSSTRSRVWQGQIAAADEWLDSPIDLGAMIGMVNGDQTSVHDILIHMVEEYARPCGHADLLRQCIRGRTGQ